jgi:CBS domain-containing protein
MLRDKVSEIMTNRVVSTDRSSTVHGAASLMEAKNIGSILIADNGKISGILTERDILGQVAEGADLKRMRVTELMTRDLRTIRPDTRIVEAAGMMVRHRFRRLPVIEDDIIVGIVTATDLTFEMNSPRVRGTVNDYMSRSVFATSPTASVAEAVRVMAANKIGAVTVVDERDIIGMLSERDILRNVVVKGADPAKAQVADVMSPDTVKVEPATQVSHACHLMYYYGLRRFPVTDRNGNLIGMITERDILKAMKDNYKEA